MSLLDVVIHRGAGAYICGEETALLTSLEGGKGFPRIKPPFPAISGLFSCPTIVNNVETLACVPFILRDGAERFAALGTGSQGGTRLFCVSGHVVRSGVYEEPVSVTLRQLIERAGGVADGRRLKAVIPGGISAKILRADEIDVAMDFNSLMSAGSMAGSGGVIVMDETTSMIEALDCAVRFFAHESCGQCSPCREGTGLAELVRAQGQTIGGWLPLWGIVTQPLAFFVFLTAALAETKRVPFDLPEGESEIIGYFVEYSGMKFGMFFLTDFLETILVASLATTLFFGGWQVPYLMPDGFHFPWGATLPVPHLLYVLLGVASFSIKGLIFCFIFMQLRWTLPRFRYDQLMALGWKGLFPVAVVNVAVTAVVLVLFGKVS